MPTFESTLLKWHSVTGLEFRPKPVVTFVDKMGVKVQEEDDTSPDDPSRFQLVPTLGVNQMMIDGRDHPLWWTFEDGEYRLTYVLRKRPNAPVK